MSDLILKTLRMRDFKTFAGEHVVELDRKPGLYYITGTNKVAPEMGSNGVGKSTIWDALIWVLWGRTGRDNRPADAVKPLGVSKSQTEVSLLFVRNGQTVQLLRTRNPNTLQVWHDEGFGHAPPDRDFKDIQQDDVPKLFGMSEEMFRRTMVLSQFGTLFLDLKPEQQAQMFTEALGLDVWLRAVEVAADQARLAQRAADQAMSDEASNINALASISTDIAHATQRADAFEADRKQRAAISQGTVNVMEHDLAAANRTMPAKPMLPDDTKLEEARELTITTGKVARDAVLVKQGTDRVLMELQTTLADLNKPKPTCKSCGQALPSKQAATKVSELHDSIRNATVIQKAAIKKMDEAKDVEHAALGLFDAQRAAYAKAKATYQPKLDAYQAAMRKVAVAEGDLARAKQVLADIGRETNTAEAERLRLVKRRGALRADSMEIADRLAQAQADMADADFWRDGFREIRLRIIDEALMELEIAASRHVGMLGLTGWGIKLDTTRETKSGSVSHSFTVLLYPPDQKAPVKWESYSGGESQRWQLAFAFALSEVLLARAGLSPNIEVLDEPTRGLSAGGVGDLLDHLRDRAIDNGRCIYFVDHHSLDKGAFDGTLMVTKTKKGSTLQWQ